MPRGTLTIEKQLAEAHVVITNVRASAELQAALAAFGYTPERIAQAEQLRDAARAHYQQKIAAYGGLRSAADALNDTEKQAQTVYKRHVKIARVALEDDRGALQALQVLGPRKTTLAGWLAQAQQFYCVALNDSAIQTKLADFSLTRTILQQGADQIEAVATRHASSLQQRSTAQNATSTRNSSLAELSTWMRDFKTVARVALRGRPQLLEQIGVRG